LDLKLFKEILWSQFGAAIDMLENAMQACPNQHWGKRIHHTEFWYITFHTLWWLDLYLSDSVEEYTPQPPTHLMNSIPQVYFPNEFTQKMNFKYILNMDARSV
jgi:hypothetical protein